MNLTEKEEIILLELKDSLKVMNDYFNIGSFCDDMICLNQVYHSAGNYGYEVYDAEKWNKYNCVTFSTIVQASIELISRLSSSPEEEISFLQTFLKGLSCWRILGYENSQTTEKER